MIERKLHSRAKHLAFVAVLLACGANAQQDASSQGSAQEAKQLMDRSDDLYKSAQYAAALPLVQRALAIREKELGPEHADVATSLDQLGRIYRATGDYSQAKVVCERALSIREKTLGPDHPTTADSFNSLANLYVDTGGYAKAEQLLQRSLAIRERALGREHPDIAKSLIGLANVYYSTGGYAKAATLYQRALVIREKSFGPEHPATAIALGSLANAYLVLGEYAKSEALHLREVAIREKALGPEHPDTADSISNFANLYVETGAYAKAEPLYLRSLAIREKTLGPDHPKVANSLTNLANLYRDMDAYAKAEPLLQRALAIFEKTLGRENADTAYAIDRLASLYADIGEYTKAEPLVKRALSIRENALGREHPNTADSLNTLGHLYFLTGEYAKAEPLYRRALAIREKAFGLQHPGSVELVNRLAEVSWAEGRSSQALALFAQAQKAQASNSTQFLISGSESRKQTYLHSLAETTYENVSFSISFPDRRSTELGITSVLQYKGRVLDSMTDNAERLRKSLRTQDQNLFEQLADVANQFSVLTYQGPGQLSLDEYRKRLDQLAGRQDQFEAELSKRSAEFRHEIAPITLATVTASIPKDAALVEWFLYAPFHPGPKDEPRKKRKLRYVAYVLKRTGDVAVVDVGEAQAIDSLIREFRDAVGDPRRLDIKARAAALSEKLIDPLRKYLRPFQRLLISPDGALNLLPMGALADPNGTYLAQHHEITYLSSARDLLRLYRISNSNARSIVMADPDFGSSTRTLAQVDRVDESLRSPELDRSGIVFRRLSNTALEAEALRNILKRQNPEVLLRSSATESKLKQVHGPRILHIASHGFFLSNQELDAEIGKRTGKVVAISSGENPLLRSGIALAGANARQSGTNDDGILTALEVAQLDLHGTELVVLSACDTGVGDVQNGEGVYGLRRALALAGAQTQVTSLWKVSDEATRTLMANYYQRLLDGEGRSGALRHAQLDMLARPELSHPYYWASFVTSGNWTPLQIH